MYRPRRSREMQDVLTFGGRLPAIVGFLLLLILAMSIGALFMPRLVEWTALVTGPVLGGQVWRLVTWPLIQLDPMSLLFGGMVVWFFAPPLVYEGGERRFAWTLLGIAAGAGAITVLASWLFGVPAGYVGLWPIVDALVILWALRHPDQQVLIYFVLPVTGRALAWITVGTNALFLLWALRGGVAAALVGFMPLIAAMALAWWLAGARLGMPRRWRLQWRDWRLERQLRRRSRHLQVVGKGGRNGPKEWMN